MEAAWRPLVALVVCVSAFAIVFPSGASALDRAQLSRSLERSMDRAHARRLSAQVSDLTTGETLYSRYSGTALIPASVEKLFTTAAALRRLGPDARLTTRIVRTGVLDDGHLAGDLVLVGEGDPSLDRAAVVRLARAVRRSGIEHVSGSVIGDESRFDAHRGGPRTSGLYDRDMGGVLGALTVGRGFSAKPGGPALAAARVLARALRATGISVRGRTTTGTAPAGARVIARSRSAPLSELVRRTNQPSDNFYAETLLKWLGAHGAGTGSTGAGVGILRAEIGAFGIAPVVADGSGLSRANRTSAADVVKLLAAMRATPSAEVFESSLAVAAESGTLRRRLRFTPAARVCRGKTGTLHAVSTLAGLCLTAQGHTIAFAFLMNDLVTWRGHVAQDRALRALVAYRASS